MIFFRPEDNITLAKMGRDANPIFRADTMALPCWPLWRRLRERSNEGALSSTGSAWVCCVVYTNSVRFQAHHAKKHMKITQRCDESSCQILKVVFNRMDVDIDSDIDSYDENLFNVPRLEDGSPVQCWSCWLHTPLPTLINIIRGLTVKRVPFRRSLL